MPITNDIVGWYVKNIIIPNFVQYDKPCFVVTEQKSKYGYTYQRDVFLSERFLINFENNIVNRFGEEGKEFLYTVGKNFGWNYGKSFKVPTIKNAKPDELIEAARFLASFVGGTWAKETSIEKIDLGEQLFQIKFQNFVVCAHNGRGHMLTEGGLAGLWAWMMNNPNIEGKQVICEGRGEGNCVTICAPPDKIQNFYKKRIIKIIETDCDTDDYRTYNKIRQSKFSNMSIKRMISNGLVKYANGRMDYKETRFFPLGIDFVFLLESLANDSETREILFQTAFNEGMAFAANEKSKNIGFIQDTLSSLGWGDLAVLDSGRKIVVQFYPWHPLFPKANKEVFLGHVSGIVSEVMGKKIIYHIKSEDFKMGYVTFEIGADRI